MFYNAIYLFFTLFQIENGDHVLNQRIGNLIHLSLKSIPVQCSGLPVEQPLGVSKESNSEACSTKKIEASKVSSENTFESGEPESLIAKSLEQQNPPSSESNRTTETTSADITVVYERVSASSKMPNTSGTNPDSSDTWCTVSAHVKSLVSRAELSLSEETREKLVPITIWDFGGQEVFYTTHQTFLSSSCIYMIAFNLFEFWQELTSNSQSENTLSKSNKFYRFD